MNAKIAAGLSALIALLVVGCAPATPGINAAIPAAPAQTVEVETTPSSCLVALDTADEAFGVTATAIDAAADLPDLIVRAAQAGMTMDAGELEAITSDLEDITTVVTEQSDRLSTLSETYATNAEACRAGRS